MSAFCVGGIFRRRFVLACMSVFLSTYNYTSTRLCPRISLMRIISLTVAKTSKLSHVNVLKHTSLARSVVDSLLYNKFAIIYLVLFSLSKFSPYALAHSL